MLFNRGRMFNSSKLKRDAEFHEVLGLGEGFD